jgi:hypothetical protein
MFVSREMIEIWCQKEIPVIYRAGKKLPLYIKIEEREAYLNIDGHWYYSENWLRVGNRKPRWLCEFGCWSVPAAWFSKIIRLCLDRYERVYVMQPYREKEQCAPACWDAQGDLCECSCLGANHGTGQPDGYYIISETFAVRWSGPRIGCRLLVRKEEQA